VPSAIVSPVFAGCVFAVFVGTGAGRFEPDRDALVFNPDGEADEPLSRADRKDYQRQLHSFLKETGSLTADENPVKNWEKLRSKSRSELDDQGAPVLHAELNGRPVRLGVTAANLMDSDAPPQILREIIEARLQSELRHSAPNGLSRTGVARDWSLLQQAQRSVTGSELGLNLASPQSIARASVVSAP